MTYCATIINNEINGTSQCPCSGDGITCVEITEEIYNNIDHYIWDGSQIVLDPDYDEKQAQKERQRKDQMMLTPSDVERALYYSDLHMDFDDLKALIAQQLPTVDIKGLAIEFRANNFYRGAVDKDGNRIIDMVGAILGYTPEDMDYLFEHKQLPVHEEPTDNEEETAEE